MKLVTSYLTENPYYVAGKKLTPKTLMLHCVGCSQPSAKVFVNNWNRSTYNRACVHAFVDANDGTVYNTLPWEVQGQHGSDTANETCIAVAFCEPAQIKYTEGSKFTVADEYHDAVCKSVEMMYNSAVELCAMLCRKFGLDPMTDIISSRRSSAKPKVSAHSDPEHLWTGLRLSYTMYTFRKDVTIAMAQKSQNRSSKKVEAEVKKIYKVKVEVSNLNIRLGPGVSYDPTGKFVQPGVTVITEISEGPGSNNGWGKLESGEGWISLDYAKPLIGE